MDAGKMTAASPSAHLDHDVLRTVLAAVLRRVDRGAAIKVLERQRNPYASTYLNEIIHVTLDNQTDVRFLVKYQPASEHASGGPRGGVAYEAKVYRHVLRHIPIPVAPYYGLHSVTTSGGKCMVLGYVDDGIRLSQVTHPAAALLAAAEWIGRFHALAEAVLPRVQSAPIKVYDSAYYRSWAKRALLYARRAGYGFSWLEPICERAAEALPKLAEEHLTVIHGEYYPQNILVRPDGIVAIDWETAAIAAGEIDLATLTEKWPENLVRECEHAYAETRWPHQRPKDHCRRFSLARIYVDLRWLRESLDWWTNSKEFGPRLERLRAVADTF